MTTQALLGQGFTKRFAVVAIADERALYKIAEAVSGSWSEFQEDGYVLAADNHVLVDAEALGVEPTNWLDAGCPQEWIEKRGAATCTFSSKIIRHEVRRIAGVATDVVVARPGAVMVSWTGDVKTVIE